MRTLHASTPVKAPARFAVAFLQGYVRDRTQAERAPEIQLRVPLNRLAGGLVLERPVTVNLSYLPQDDLERPGLSIEWQPADTTLFPRFTGSIQAEATGLRECLLSIDGSYTAPFGAPGAVFDALAGVHIAQATLEGLLHEFQAEIEADYTDRTI
jgi:hypothetical protein